jgi:hypothetical protein
MNDMGAVFRNFASLYGLSVQFLISAPRTPVHILLVYVPCVHIDLSGILRVRKAT